MKNNVRMKLTRLSLALLLAFGLASSVQAQQGLILKSSSGNLTEIQFSNVSKLTFVNEVMTLVSSTGVPGQSFALNTLSRITFGNVTSSGIIDHSNNASSLSLYPTLATSSINLRGASEGTFVAIYGITGSKVMQLKVTSDVQSMDVSGLKSGLYMVRINGETLKFCKK